MGCCSSSPIEDLRAPLLAHSSAQPAAAGESYPPSLDYNSSSSSSSASTSTSYHHPPVPTSAHAQHKHSSAKSEAEPADVERNAKAQTTEKKNESDEPSLTASGLRVIDAPRPEGATEQMTKEEEFEFYKKKMEQLNREKEDTNARFLKEEREKQKLLDKQHKKPSLLTFFKGGEEEEAEFAIGAPQGFKHESHIGWTPDGGFDIFNIPNEWKKLMSKAGVTEEQMQDKETAMFIVSFVASTLGNQQGGQAAAQAPAAHPVQAEERSEGEAEVQVSPNENSQAAEQERPGEEESIPSAPPAPLAPAPAQPALGGSSAPPPPPVLRPSVADEGSSGDMFSAIRGGVALKKVAALPDVKNLSVQEEDSIAGALARALQSRRFAIREEEEEPEEEDNGEWDD